MTFVTRFAPSPTGPLHLGHAYSACLAFDLAKAHSGIFLLRIEDIDRVRSRPEWETQIFEDLRWLGLDWPTPVMRQSDRLHHYSAALDQLWARGLVYPCTCSRADIQAALSAPQEGQPVFGPDGLVYPGTCRHTDRDVDRPLLRGTVLRLDMEKALAEITQPLTFEEHGMGQPETILLTPAQAILSLGDIVLARKEMGTSYHLSVVVDDAAQSISHVVRGKDLSEATMIHVVLQRLLGLATPIYHHHRLIRDDAGKRLAKRDDARAIQTYRAEGCSPGYLRFLTSA